ncbi:DMT family transporter, partial [Gluconobacter oxydans]|uniref:DMT family transporter n=1 Tax=Gluconobacter oxydans TaxID=442 RepID=UPI0039E8EF07
MKQNIFSSGILLALLGYAAFSISDACSKGLAGHLDPFEVAFSGGVFGFILLPFIRRPDEPYSDIFATTRPGMWILRAVSTFVSTAASVMAFMLLPMPEALSLMFLMPFFVTIISVTILKEKVSFWTWLSVAVGFLGVLIVLRPGARTFHLGHVCAIVAALANASSVVASRVGGAGSPRRYRVGSSRVGPR